MRMQTNRWTDRRKEGAVVPNWPFQEMSVVSREKKKKPFVDMEFVAFAHISCDRFVGEWFVFVYVKRFPFVDYFLSDLWSMQLPAEMSTFTFAWAKHFEHSAADDAADWNDTKNSCVNFTVVQTLCVCLFFCHFFVFVAWQWRRLCDRWKCLLTP